MKDLLSTLREDPSDILQITSGTAWSQEQETTPAATDMDTLGTLIDKLVTVNLKMWHNQEILYKIRRMSTDEFVKEWGHRLEELKEQIARCCDLNYQRTCLMDEIDIFFRDTTGGKKRLEDLVREQHKTY